MKKKRFVMQKFNFEAYVSKLLCLHKPRMYFVATDVTFNFCENNASYTHH